MDIPKVITIYSRTPSCGKKTIALNAFLAYAYSKPGIRIMIVDFSSTETMRYSLMNYGRSPFTSLEFLSDISEDIVVKEALQIYENPNSGSFIRILPSSGCSIPSEGLLNRVKYRINALFFKNTIDLLVFIAPVNIEESSITMATILNSDNVWIISSEKFPAFSLTKSTIQNFLTFLKVPTFLILNEIHLPLVFKNFDQNTKEMESKLRHPIFYCIPWIDELNIFSGKGIFGMEFPESKVNEVFYDLIAKFRKFTENGVSTPSDEEDQIIPPNALFLTDRTSGASMYYYFFGKAVDEMKNPTLITAALNSIALMVSETAGRPGELRSIDNGNMKIILRKGKRVIGILYSPVETEIFGNLLFQCVIRFEREFKDAIDDFFETGRIGGFNSVSEIVEEIFESYIFDIVTVSNELRKKILTYMSELDKIHDNSEEIFQRFVKENLSSQEIRDLLVYEFTTDHNPRHEFLLELGVNPRSKQRIIEEETGRSLCNCTESPKYVQIQGFDALGILDLPEKLRPTARAFFTSDVLSPETAAKITKRNTDLELESLEELQKLGYVRRVISS